MSARIAIVVTATDDRLQVRAAALAESLELPVVQTTAGYDYTLELSDQGLQLRDQQRPRSRPLVLDLVKVVSGLRPHDCSRKQPLARAMGKGVHTIVDATAGLGHDAVLLAAMGFEVVAIERAAAIYALLEDALLRARDTAIYQRRLDDRLRYVLADASDYFGSLAAPPDVVYLDPMYPPKRKQSALTRKALRILREIVGEDSDAGHLLIEARKHARRRVVVKRPHYAPTLAEGPDMTIKSKLVRYDVYLSASRSGETYAGH